MSTTLAYALDSEPVIHLLRSDPALRDLVHAVGPYSLELRDDRFVALARAIVGQQLSVSAARTIWSRLVDLLGTVSPDSIGRAEFAELRGVGLSNAKATYLTDLSRKVLDGAVDLDRLDSLTDHEVIESLTEIKGIGRWTAEMFLIFSLGRLDVFALDDVGLQRSLRLLIGASDPLTASELASRSDLWRPYRSVASLYLWEAFAVGFFADRQATEG